MASKFNFGKYALLDTNIGKRTTGPHWDGVAVVKAVLCQKNWHPFFKYNAYSLTKSKCICHVPGTNIALCLILHCIPTSVVRSNRPLLPELQGRADASGNPTIPDEGRKQPGECKLFLCCGLAACLTRAPLGYFYNAPHWGGGGCYFEPPPLWSPKLLDRS